MVQPRFGQSTDQFAACFGRRVRRDAPRRYLAGRVNTTLSDSSFRTTQSNSSYLHRWSEFSAIACVTEANARAVLQRFGAFADQFAPCFGRHVQRDALSRYLAGLVNDTARESMLAMHGRLSDADSYRRCSASSPTRRGRSGPSGRACSR